MKSLQVTTIKWLITSWPCVVNSFSLSQKNRMTDPQSSSAPAQSIWVPTNVKRRSMRAREVCCPCRLVREGALSVRLERRMTFTLAARPTSKRTKTKNQSQFWSKPSWNTKETRERHRCEDNLRWKSPGTRILVRELKWRGWKSQLRSHQI